MVKKIGIIGTGHIGGMLIKSLITYNTIPPNRFYIFNRTSPAAEKFKRTYPGINLVQTNKEVIENADWIFISVKPLALKSLLDEIGTVFSDEQLVISTLMAPPLSNLDKMLRGKIVRIYPSITQSTGHGVCLVAFGHHVTSVEKSEFIASMSSFGKVMEIPEEHFRTCGDITSCGPGFMACMVGSLVKIAEKRGLDQALTVEMARETMLGTALLMQEQNLNFDELISQVANPGGSTEAGLKVLAQPLLHIIEHLFEATMARQQSAVTNVMDSLRGYWETV